MVQVSYPGVYVQEVPSGSQTITGVATSIAAFVGMTKDGPVNTPTLVLGFTDYARTFSDDTSQGELTDQVRQFFLNGGQQAYIVRIGQGITNAATVPPLTAPSGTKLTLTAISGGASANSLRVTVDYDTNFPELTFNLTIFQEVIDASGNSSTGGKEVLKNLSMDPNSPAFVETVVAKTSTFVSAKVDPTTNIAAATGFSASAAQAADIVAALVAAIPAASTSGKFKISVGGGPFRTIAVPKTGVTTAAQLQDLINQQAQLTNTTPVTVTTPDAGGGLQYLEIAAARDVLLDRAADSDVAAPLGLGTAQGGIEVGLYSNNRPPVSGLASQIDVGDLSQILDFARSAKSGWLAAANHSLKLAAPIPLNLACSAVVLPAPNAAASLMRDSAVTGGLASLVNARACLVAIAGTITNTSPLWNAKVQGVTGYRLVLTPKGGPATGGAGESFDATAAPDGWVVLGTDPSIFGLATNGNPIVSIPASTDLQGGDNGSKPAPGDYQNAYIALDKVDLFNLLVLPRVVKDADDRDILWGPASSFAVQRRAFLLIDAATEVRSRDAAAAAVVHLRGGLVKDHSALYWPKVKINPDGNGRFIDASGSIAGVMARIDANRGVWKAPAGIEADLRGVLAVEVPLSDQENGTLNPQALNAIRTFPNGIVSWGARTMDGFDNSGDDDFKYVPVRRFESFIEESLIRGLKFAVFEPNDEPLWAQIRLAAGAFMNNLFRQGAFAGRTTRDAYFVKVDSETTTQNDINLGIVNVLVGFAPLKPAEFVVITIKQLAGQVQV